MRERDYYIGNVRFSDPTANSAIDQVAKLEYRQRRDQRRRQHQLDSNKHNNRNGQNERTKPTQIREINTSIPQEEITVVEFAPKSEREQMRTQLLGDEINFTPEDFDDILDIIEPNGEEKIVFIERDDPKRQELRKKIGKNVLSSEDLERLFRISTIEQELAKINTQRRNKEVGRKEYTERRKGLKDELRLLQQQKKEDKTQKFKRNNEPE